MPLTLTRRILGAAGFAALFVAVPVAPLFGQGTGTGTEAGRLGSTGGGAEAGGLGSTSGGQAPSTRPIYGERGQAPGPRPDPLLTPRVVNPNEVKGLFGKDEPPLVREALLITDPGERSLAMVRIARTSIFMGRPDLGHIAVFQAAKDAQLESNITLRDQRLVNVIQTAYQLAEEHMRETTMIQGNAPADGPVLPLPVNVDRASNLERARQEWNLAFNLAFEVTNPSARTEVMYRVVESESIGSSALILIRETYRLNAGRPDPEKVSPEVRKYSDELLGIAIGHALRNERPVWRDRSLIIVAANASSSGQFVRALQAARAIPQAEARTDGLLRIAENQVLFDKQREATSTYEEVAQTVAEIPDADPRETLVGVLIDSLIAYGRFNDARATTVLYDNPANRPIALAAVAESQGRRNLAGSARKWIEQESDPALRSLLYRKLNDGVLYSVEQRRANELSRPNEPIQNEPPRPVRSRDPLMPQPQPRE